MFKHILEISIKEWFDKINGNSYFSSRVYYDDELILVLPFQYGYGEHGIGQSFKKIMGDNLIRGAKSWQKRQNSNFIRYPNFCDDKKIKLITHKTENCLKRDVMSWGTK